MVVPTLTTTAMSSITQTTAVSGGNILSNGGGSITGRGVCWALTANPTISNSVTTDGTGIGSFPSNLTGLQPGVTYHVRAYAVNSAGTSYGNDVTFTTLPAVPTLSTAAISAITLTSAVSGGNITNANGAAVTARGICWSTTATPTLTGSHTTDGTGIGIFDSNMTGLTAGTTYHVRAYATNSVGTSYGNEVTFTTLVTFATLTTATPGSITQTTAESGGDITSSGGSAVTVRGTCWATTANPTTANSHTSDGAGIGGFTSSLTGLTSGTTYHVRAYATNSAGTSYGEDLTFTTAAPGLPTLTTATLSSLGLTAVTTGGEISDDGTGAITNRGVCWSSTPGPDITDNTTSNGAGTGAFTSSITGLTENSTYYVRAFATNAAGTAYGNQIVFTTDFRDADDNIYSAVHIGSQIWMGENLKTTQFENGDPIPTTSNDISTETDPIYQWAYLSNPANISTYGRLYTWYVAHDTRNVCPTDWHVPSDLELESLKTYLGGEAVAGGKLKETGTSHWQTPNTDATDEVGFKALPGGYRLPNGQFHSMGISYYIWSSSVDNLTLGWGQGLKYNDAIMLRGGYYYADGVSIRCVKD